MADLSEAKLQTGLWPPLVKEATWLRLEPLLKADELVALHLFGIPLVSQLPDPITKQHAAMTQPILDKFIQRAVEIAEAETGLVIMETSIEEALPFDRPAFEALGYMRLSRTPIWGVEKLSVRTTDGVDIFNVPLEWISPGSLYRGRITIVPTLVSAVTFTSSPTPANGAAGAAFLNALSSYIWMIPEYFWIRCVVGFPQNLIPAILNELIGLIAAMNILSNLAATFITTSHSIGVDGLSQSISGPGPQVWAVRLKDMADQRRRLTEKVRTVFGKRWALGVA